MATLPSAWRYRVSAGTGWPGVRILWLGEMDSLILVWQHVNLSEQIRPWDTLTHCWDVKQATNILFPHLLLIHQMETPVSAIEIKHLSDFVVKYPPWEQVIKDCSQWHRKWNTCGCPARFSGVGSILLWDSGRGDFSLGVNMSCAPIRPELFRMRV